MRRVLVTAGLVALLGLSACEKPKEETVAPAAPKYFGRQQQFYAGQEQLQSVESATVAVGKSGALEMTANASAPSAGYTNLGFMRRIYAAPPKDGVYELDIVGDKPASGGAPGVTPVEVKGAWDGYPKDRLKGVRLITKTGNVVAMLPPPA
jgi:hypothetical protein